MLDREILYTIETIGPERMPAGTTWNVSVRRVGLIIVRAATADEALDIAAQHVPDDLLATLPHDTDVADFQIVPHHPIDSARLCRKAGRELTPDCVRDRLMAMAEASAYADMIDSVDHSSPAELDAMIEAGGWAM